MRKEPPGSDNSLQSPARVRFSQGAPRKDAVSGGIIPPAAGGALLLIFAALLSLLSAGRAAAYPLDGYEATGIARLLAYAHLPQPPGAKLERAEVDIRLADRPDIELPRVSDPEFSAQLRELAGSAAGSYGLAVLDLSDPERPVYGEVNELRRQNPGSVGKLLAALGVFQILADLYPDDEEARTRILKETMVTADEFIVSDTHDAPFYDIASKRRSWRPIRKGDTASLYTWLDWMLSASSNAAASMVIREAVLLRAFGRDYQTARERGPKFFAQTPKKELSRILELALQEPARRNGIDLERFRQGSLFTWRGKQIVPGTSSLGTPRELARYMLLLEQGKLVDAFSSREIKRLLYMTQRRIRYASAPRLWPAALYFKSGSLYKCKSEPNFVCRKYQGNDVNLLNSVCTVEYPARERKLFYIVAVMSNVLYVNSAVEHQTLATRIQKLLEARHSERPGDAANAAREPGPILDEDAGDTGDDAEDDGGP